MTLYWFWLVRLLMTIGKKKEKKTDNEQISDPCNLQMFVG